MRLTVILPVMMIVGAQCGFAWADEVTIQLDNESAKAVVGLYATPKDDSAASDTNLLAAGSVAAAATGEIAISMAAQQCVFDLRIAFEDGSASDRPDVDLCQTDALIIN